MSVFICPTSESKSANAFQSESQKERQKNISWQFFLLITVTYFKKLENKGTFSWTFCHQMENWTVQKVTEKRFLFRIQRSSYFLTAARVQFLNLNVSTQHISKIDSSLSVLDGRWSLLVDELLLEILGVHRDDNYFLWQTTDGSRFHLANLSCMCAGTHLGQFLKSP